MILKQEKQFIRFTIRYMPMIAMMFLFGFSASSTIAVSIAQNLAMGGIGILAFLILTGNTTDDFYTYIALIPYASLVTLDNKNILFVFLLVSVLKLIISNLKSMLTLGSFIAIIIILLTECIHDFGNVTIGHFIYLLSFLLYFIIFTSYYNFKGYDNRRAMFVLVSSLFSAIVITIFISGGNLASFVNSTDVNYRFGEEARNLGGAMGIPIYSLIIISILLFQLIMKKNNLFKKILFVGIILFVTFIAILTGSRSFFLGASILFLCLALSVFLKKPTKIKSVLFVLIICGTVYLFINPTFIDSFYNKLEMRGSVDISTGRFDIYIDSINYLSSNFSALLFGEGALNYVNIGKEKGYLFSMMAHNIFLDGLMSWGIVGFGSFILLTLKYAKRCRDFFKVKTNILKIMPLIVLLTCYLTAGTFNYFNIYIYFLILIINTYAAGEK